jgi:site-specific recombinase XerC
MIAKSIPQKEEILSLSHLHDSCLQAEKIRNISDRSLKELRCHLDSFSTFCRERGLRSLQELTPAFLKDFLLFRNPEGKASLGKALVWTLQKFGTHLALLQRLYHNPAAVLSHPKIFPPE